MLALMKKYHNRDDGFTLIELLIVVLIIGILAAVAIPVYLGIQTNARHSAVKADTNNTVKQVQVALTENATTIPTTASSTGIAGFTDNTVRPDGAKVTTTPTGSGQFQVQGVGTDGYTYTYDSNTGQFTEGSGTAFGGGNPSSSPYSATTVETQNTNNAKTTFTGITNLVTDGKTATPSWFVNDGSDSLALSGGAYYVTCGNYANEICKTTGNGTSTLFAGAQGPTGSIDGIGTAATFTLVPSLTTDANGNIYVLDVTSTIMRVRKINPTTGQVSTVTTVSAANSANSNRSQLSITPDGKFNVAYLGSDSKLRIGQINPANNTITNLYTSSNSGGPVAGWTASDGTVYFSENSYIYKTIPGNTTTATKVSTNTSSANIAMMTGDSTYLYFGGAQTGYGISRMNRSTGVISTITTYNSSAACTPTVGTTAISGCIQDAAGGIAIGADGNLYFEEASGSSLNVYSIGYLG